MSLNYNQYLGAKKCCDLKVQGPQGPQGYQGPAAVGPRGVTGAQGAAGSSSPWIPMNGVGSQGSGYTGIGITGQDVLIYGNLLVTGGIDPTYLALTPQTTGPQGFINPLWVDTSSNLRSEKILLANGINTLALDETTITHTNATTPFEINSNKDITINTAGEIFIGNTTGGNGTIIVVDDSISTMTFEAVSSINLNSIGLVSIGDTNTQGNGTKLVVDDPNGQINLNANVGGINLVSSNVISLNATPSGDISLFTAGDIRIGNIGGVGNQNELNINTTKMTAQTTNGFQLLDSNIQYPSTFSATSTTLGATSTYAQSYNGSALTSTLPVVSSTNVGTQYLITNTNAGNLTVASQSSQLIYSSSGAASATTRTINTGHSQIFTAIRTTSNANFGWSMV